MESAFGCLCCCHTSGDLPGAFFVAYAIIVCICSSPRAKISGDTCANSLIPRGHEKRNYMGSRRYICRMVTRNSSTPRFAYLLSLIHIKEQSMDCSCQEVNMPGLNR